MGDGELSAEWWRATLDPREYLASRGQRGSTSHALRAVAAWKVGQINARTALESVEYASQRHEGLGPVGILLHDLACAVVTRPLSLRTSFDQTLAARSKLMALDRFEEVQSLSAAVSRELGIALLLKGEIEESDRQLRTSTDLRTAQTVDDPEARGALAITTYLLEEPLEADRWCEEAPRAVFGPSSRPRLIARALLATTERADVLGGRQAISQLLLLPQESEWRALAEAVQGYFRIREVKFSSGLDELESAAAISASTGSLDGYWLEWIRLLRGSFFVQTARYDDAWRILARMSPDKRHVLCPNRELAGLRLRLNDVEGAELALVPCIEAGDLHVPRSRASVRWIRAAISFTRKDFATSDGEADLALLFMRRNDSVGPLYFVPPRLGLSLLARARSRQEGDLLPFILRAEQHYEAMPERLTYPLTTREREVLGALSQFETLAEVAAILYVSRATVKTHVRKIYSKLGVNKRSDAIAAAQWMGIDTTRSVSD